MAAGPQRIGSPGNAGRVAVERGGGTRRQGSSWHRVRGVVAVVIAVQALAGVLDADGAQAGPSKPTNKPVNTALPTVSGLAQEGKPLTADPGSWSGVEPISYSYQWQRCDASLTSCSSQKISEATYPLTAADVGFVIRVKVTARNAAGQGTAISAATAKVEPGPAAPTNTAPPAILGTVQEGRTVTADSGAWSGTQPISFGYQWQRCDELACSDILGATGSNYTATAADVDLRLKVQVTASNSIGWAIVDSAETVQVLAAPPVNTAAPTISGTVRDGRTLTATTGSWSSSRPVTYAQQWRRCDSAGAACADIAGATATTYTLRSADVGFAIRVVVTATNAGGSSSAASAATATVAADPPSSIAPPSIAGTATEGQTLTAAPGTWSGTQPIGYDYQWRRCDTGGSGCIDIGVATAAAYTLEAGDVGHTIRVAVTASNSGGAATASSAAAGPVSAAVGLANTSPPTISGAAQAGASLTADPGSWSGSQPINYGYQWRRCNSSGASCANIAGATAQTYGLVAGDVGSTIRVAVTASNSSGSSTAVSAPTAPVTAPAETPVNTSSPKISGTVQQSQSLTADPGTWTGTEPIAYVYQWRRCNSSGVSCVDIAGATARTFTPTSADVGSTLRVAVTATNGAGSSTASSTFTTAVTATGSIGYRDHSLSGAGTAPTGSKPESKLWFNDGAWWASMWAGSGQGFHIFKLDTATQRWTDTGVQLDDRAGARADALWDGSHLYVASHVFSGCGCSTATTGYPSVLYRYSYSRTAQTYTLDAGFPVQLNNTQTETLVIDRDSTGTLWATWAQASKVMISHTQAGDDRSWTTPSVLPVAGAGNLKSDDISSVVAYGPGQVGVMWSNQNDSAMYFASHTDGAPDSSWTVAPAVKSPLIADDHINLKSLQSDGSGRVFAVTKTSLNDAVSPDANAPVVLLHVRTPSGQWSNAPVWRVSEGVTRPILIIDESNSALHVFATSSESGGVIREKVSPIASISFPTGTGTTFLKDASSSALNNPTASKQNVTSESGLALVAGNDSTGFYWHNFRAIP